MPCDMGVCQHWARLVSKVLFVIARASDLWLRLRHPQLPTTLGTSEESEEGADSPIELLEESSTPTSSQDTPCDHRVTTTAGSNGFVSKKRCRICGLLLEERPRC